MSYTPPEQCSWVTSCKSYKCKGDNYNTCLTLLKSNGPTGYTHTINSNYTIAIAGHTIPLVITDRLFNVIYSKEYGMPNKSDIKYIDSGGTQVPIECKERPADKPSLTVSEDCSVEKSTLHYLDHRNNVCLYRYQKDKINMKVESSEEALIKEPWQVGKYHQAQIKTHNYTASRLEEWRLIIGGQERVLTTTTEELHPFGPKNSGKSRREEGATSGLYLDYKPDPETRKVLLFPTPPSMGIPWSDVIVRLGAYEFGYDTPEGAESYQNRLDGGNKDHYYPEWCRNLQEDPFWRKAADNRYMIDWFHSDLTVDNGFVPSITVDPIPRGTFVKHPQVGEVYQFLVEKRTGGYKLETSPNIDDIINNAVPEAERKTGTTLYYPIGVI